MFSERQDRPEMFAHKYLQIVFWLQIESQEPLKCHKESFY